MTGLFLCMMLIMFGPWMAFILWCYMNTVHYHYNKARIKILLVFARRKVRKWIA